MEPSMQAAGSRVLVTGASSGIGAALARILAAQGATVGLVARREDRLSDVLADCRRTSPESRLWVADLASLEAAERVAVEAWDAFGHLDVLVNNAAIPKRRSVTELTPAEVEMVMRVNFFAPVRMTLAILPRMLARDAGFLVNVSSMGGRLGIVHEAAYSASKFALCGWSESLAIDLWHTGVQVRLIEPGPIDTEIWDQPDNEAPLYQGPKVAPEVVAEGIVAALGDDRFEHYLPDMKGIVDAKSADIDQFLAGVAAMAPPPTRP
ncbi:MAG: SDR family NAD(P)-dependent oxidoreductase [Acidimicrobiales bacterium]